MSVMGQQTQRTRDSAPARRIPPADTSPGAVKGSGQAKMPPHRTWLWFGLALLVNYLLVRVLFPAAEAPVTVPYTFFKEEVKKGNVGAIFSRGETLTGRFKAPVTYPLEDEQKAVPSGAPQTASERGGVPRDLPKTARKFTTTLPSFVDPGLEAFLIEHGVEISAEPIDEGGLLDGPVRVWPNPALHRLLRLDVSAGGAAGRHGGRSHGHRQEQGASLRPGERYKSHF